MLNYCYLDALDYCDGVIQGKPISFMSHCTSSMAVNVNVYANGYYIGKTHGLIIVQVSVIVDNSPNIYMLLLLQCNLERSCYSYNLKNVCIFEFLMWILTVIYIFANLCYIKKSWMKQSVNGLPVSLMLDHCITKTLCMK